MLSLFVLLALCTSDFVTNTGNTPTIHSPNKKIDIVDGSTLQLAQGNDTESEFQVLFLTNSHRSIWQGGLSFGDYFQNLNIYRGKRLVSLSVVEGDRVNLTTPEGILLYEINRLMLSHSMEELSNIVSSKMDGGCYYGHRATAYDD